MTVICTPALFSLSYLFFINLTDTYVQTNSIFTAMFLFFKHAEELVFVILKKCRHAYNLTSILYFLIKHTGTHVQNNSH